MQGKKNINNYKTIEDVYLLGSSFVDNYYTNLIFFLPRLFFNNEDEIKLAVHRSLSNKFKEYILKVTYRPSNWLLIFWA